MCITLNVNLHSSQSFDMQRLLAADKYSILPNKKKNFKLQFQEGNESDGLPRTNLAPLKVAGKMNDNRRKFPPSHSPPPTPQKKNETCLPLQKNGCSPGGALPIQLLPPKSRFRPRFCRVRWSQLSHEDRILELHSWLSEFVNSSGIFHQVGTSCVPGYFGT